jgi:hypothetical protein
MLFCVVKKLQVWKHYVFIIWNRHSIVYASGHLKHFTVVKYFRLGFACSGVNSRFFCLLDASRSKANLEPSSPPYYSAGAGLVCYLHYRLLVRMTNKYNRTNAVFAPVLSPARVLFQWFSTFWTINHLQIPS